MSNNLESLSIFPFDNFISNTDINTEAINYYELQSCLFTIENNSISAKVYPNNVSHSLRRNRFDESNDTAIVICSKNQSNILRNSLEKLRSFEIDKKYDILLVDDRSTENILALSDEYQTSYLRIDNNADKFNYSMLNNIAASYLKIIGKKTIIFFNNDLWPKNATSLDNILKKHVENNSFVTGCKLIYPSKTEYEQLGKPQHLLQSHLEKIYGTIQHGGIYFFPRQSIFVDKKRPYFNENFVVAPLHSWRFYEEDTPLASDDNRCFAVTGALQVVDIKTFIEINGFNMTMGMAFQDIDLCIKAVNKNLTVMYIGTETMIHAESITNASENITQKPEFLSDNIVWDLTWGINLPSVIGFQKIF